MTWVLVVDDEPHAARVVQLALERAGYQVEEAGDGLEALERLRARDFDAVVTDVCMPRLGGRDLCLRIRAEFPDRAPLLCVVTSRPEDEHRAWTRDLGGVEFLEKPLSLRRLVALLDRHFAPQAEGATTAR